MSLHRVSIPGGVVQASECDVGRSGMEERTAGVSTIL